MLWMAATKFPMWKRDKGIMPFIVHVFLFAAVCALLLLVWVAVKPLSLCNNGKESLYGVHIMEEPITDGKATGNIEKLNCIRCPQAAPVVANKVEGVQHPFFISLADLGSPEKPNRNFLRMLKGKPFRKPDISHTIQEVLGNLETSGFHSRKGIVVDVGANVGMAAFVATAMGYKVVAFEAVFENLQRLCDGMYLNRAGDMVTFYHAAVSDVPGNLTMHKVVGRLDNSVVSATGAKLAFKSNELIPVSVRSITLDTVIHQSELVILLKIDVQGWEYHVLKGATSLLSRKPGDAPYIIYEDDERLLHESNTSSNDIKEFLASMGYNSCTKQGTDTHCKKKIS
ncbi:hypothetical protein SUGI_0756060 [Cryptomeria japonica]|nr:hypothetical protein SUGI_0756060 [Cryptomeria japonica]